MQGDNRPVSQLLGVTMCGGESRRMGTDKGLMKRGNTTWAEMVTGKLRELHLPVVVSINQSQQLHYRQIFLSDTMVVDCLNLQGPLNGLLSVHQANPQADLLLLACDMIDMKLPVLQNLVQCYRLEPAFDCYAYHRGSFFEPLCAIYTATALNAIQSAFNQGVLSDFSLQNILRNRNTKSLPIDDLESFNNKNSPPAI